MIHGDVVLALLLYALFAVISTIGVFLIAKHFMNRRVAILSSLATLLFFVILLVAISLLVEHLVGPPGTGA